MCADLKPSSRCASTEENRPRSDHRGRDGEVFCRRTHRLISNNKSSRREAAIRQHINSHPGLRRRRELLDPIPGIAETTAASLLAEITDITQYRSARQVAAYAGLVPRERQSGSSVRGRTRLSKIGNARLRKALYFPAITALRCSPFFQAWAEGLRQRGKCKMSVIGAAMRKLVHLAYGVLKTGRPFDPAWTKICLTRNTVSNRRARAAETTQVLDDRLAHCASG